MARIWQNWKGGAQGEEINSDIAGMDDANVLARERSNQGKCGMVWKARPHVSYDRHGYRDGVTYEGVETCLIGVSTPSEAAQSVTRPHDRASMQSGVTIGSDGHGYDASGNDLGPAGKLSL